MGKINKYCKIKNNKKEKKGFTLIELLVVIAVIAILAGLVIIRISNANRDARDSKRRADLDQMSKSLEKFAIDNGRYPSETTCDSSVGSCGVACPCSDTDWNYVNASYIGLSIKNADLMSLLPKDPINNSTYYYNYEPACNQVEGSVDCTGKGCCYYFIRARLEGGGNYTINGSRLY